LLTRHLLVENQLPHLKKIVTFGKNACPVAAVSPDVNDDTFFNCEIQSLGNKVKSHGKALTVFLRRSGWPIHGFRQNSGFFDGYPNKVFQRRAEPKNVFGVEKQNRVFKGVNKSIRTDQELSRFTGEKRQNYLAFGTNVFGQGSPDTPATELPTHWVREQKQRCRCSLTHLRHLR